MIHIEQSETNASSATDVDSATTHIDCSSSKNVTRDRTFEERVDCRPPGDLWIGSIYCCNKMCPTRKILNTPPLRTRSKFVLFFSSKF